MMRFCMVTTFYPPYSFGGDATYVRALARALVARGHEVRVVHCADAFRVKTRERPAEPEPEAGIEVVRLESPLGVLSPLLTQQTGHPVLKTPALRRALAGPFDVVHFHNISLVGGPAVLAMSNAPVTLYTLHEHWLVCATHILWKDRSGPCDRPTCFRCSLRSGIPPQLWRYGTMRRKHLRHVDRLLAPSAFTAGRHRDPDLGELPITVLPLFSTLKPPAPVVPGGNRFLYVGRIEAEKGVTVLAETFAVMPEQELDIVGDGSLREELARRFAGVANIRIHGPLPQADLIARYGAASSLIFPSLCAETFGLTIVEAMACGTPALVNAGAGGAPEIVEQTGGGLIYRDRGELAASVRRLAADPRLRAELSARAREGYLRFYTEETHLQRYLAEIAAARLDADARRAA